MTDASEFSLDVVAPIFPVTDVAQAREYYTEKLLFTVGFEWSDREGEPLSYAIIQHGDTELHLTLVNTTHKARAYFFVTNVRAYYEAVKSAGAVITHDIEDQPWEMREFEIADPDGNAIIFGEHLSRIK